jgi:hypothetical protein
MIRRVIIAAVVGAAALAASAGPGQASSRVALVPGAIFVDTTVAMAGERFVYSDPERHRQLEVHVVGPGRRDRMIFRRRRPHAANFAGSSKVIVLLHITPAARAVRVHAGPVDGPLTEVSRCARGSLAQFGEGIAAAESHVAYVDDGCETGGSAELVVREVLDGTEKARVPLPSGARVDYLSMAGRYVSYRLTAESAGAQIVVYDWRTGTEALRVPAGSQLDCPERTRVLTGFCGLDVQADGKVAELLERIHSDCGGTISWLSPEDPTRHHVTDRACAPDGHFDEVTFALARDRVLFAPRETFGIAVSDLSGQVLRDFGGPFRVYGFDGERVFAPEWSCIGTEIVAKRHGDTDEPWDHGDPSCPVRLSKARLLLGARPTVRVKVRCPNGCFGPIVAGGTDWLDGESPKFLLRPGRVRRIEIPLVHDAAMLERAEGRRRLGVFFYYHLWNELYYNPWRSALGQVSSEKRQRLVAKVVRRPSVAPSPDATRP